MTYDLTPGECPAYCPTHAGGDHDHTDPFPQIALPAGMVVEVVSADSTFNGMLGQVARRTVSDDGHETYFVDLFAERGLIPFGRGELRS